MSTEYHSGMLNQWQAITALLFIPMFVSAYIYIDKSYIISSLGIFTILILIIRKFGLFSVTSIMSAILIIPSLTPLIGLELFKSDYISLHNMFLQEDAALLNKAVLVSLLAIAAYYLALLRSSDTNVHMNHTNNFKNYLFSKLLYVFFCMLILIFCWVIAPSGTILYYDYHTTREGYFQNVAYAEALFTIFWVLAFMNYSKYRSGILRRLFEVISILVVAWMFLHGKRVAIIGLFCIFIVHMAEKGNSKKITIFSTAIFSVLLIIERLRNTPLLAIDKSQLQELLMMHKQIEGDSVFKYGGGVSNVFVTLLDSIHLFDSIHMKYLYGKSYWDYIYNMIPLNVIVYLDLPSRNYFSDLISSFYSYNGGMYIFAPAYGNFGITGVIVMGIILAKLVRFTDKNFKSSNHYLQAGSLIIFYMYSRAVWYDPLGMLKSGLLIILMVFMMRPQRHLANEQQTTVDIYSGDKESLHKTDVTTQ